MKPVCLIVLTTLLLFHETSIERIQRFHKRVIAVKPGDTVKLKWDFHIDEKNRGEKFESFICGYQKKGISF